MSREDKMSKKICCTGSLSQFYLGMTDYNCCGVPEPKRKKLSLLKKKLEKLKSLLLFARFNIAVSSEEIEKSSKGWVPLGTAKSTNWEVCTFQQLLMQRNKRIPQEAFPLDILQKEYPTEILCNCLQCFFSRARRVDRTHYSPRTLYQMLCGFLRIARWILQISSIGKMLVLRNYMVCVIRYFDHSVKLM